MAAVTGKVEQGEITRAKLIAAGRDLFAERGFGGAGTEEIVRRAKVTRGALYHHFTDKKDLFRAVYEQVEVESVDQIAARMADGSDPLSLLQIGVRAFLDLTTEPTTARIALIEAPSVLGWQEWREIDLRYGLGLVIAGLQGAMDAGALKPQPVRPLAHLLLGAISEAGMVVANADDPEAARAEVEPPLLGLLEGLRAPA
jgi:AcrR family transcriptional regulator